MPASPAIQTFTAYPWTTCVRSAGKFQSIPIFPTQAKHGNPHRLILQSGNHSLYQMQQTIAYSDTQNTKRKTASRHSRGKLTAGGRFLYLLCSIFLFSCFPLFRSSPAHTGQSPARSSPHGQYRTSIPCPGGS